MPGSSALTRMLSGPSSTASERISPITPHLAAAYGVRIAKPRRPASDDTFMMLALADLRSSGTARRTQLNCPVRSIAMQRSHSSGSIASTLPVGPAMPALLTRQSSPPRRCSPSSKKRCDAGRDDTSHTLVLELRIGLRELRERRLVDVADVHHGALAHERARDLQPDAVGARASP